MKLTLMLCQEPPEEQTNSLEPFVVEGKECAASEVPFSTEFLDVIEYFQRQEWTA
jgi:hypothetical protein